MRSLVIKYFWSGCFAPPCLLRPGATAPPSAPLSYATAYGIGPFVPACLSVSLSCPVLSVCSVGVLWPNRWMDQYETWHAGSPGHIVLDGDPDPPPPRGRNPQFSAHIYVAKWLDGSRCHVTASEIGLSPCDIVLDGTQLTSPKGGGAREPPQFSARVYCGWMMDQDATQHGGRSRLRPHCVGPTSPSPKGAVPPIFGQYLYVVTKWLDGSSCHLVER